MAVRWSAFLVWALVAGSALAWGLKLFVQSAPVPPQALVAEPGHTVRGDLTRLLGVDPPPVVAEAPPEPAADARFNLVGVVSPRSPRAAREGVALIAVDGKPPRAYRIGAVVEGPHVLQTVEARGAKLGPRDGTALIALTLPPPAPAATGVLPPPLSARGAAASRPSRSPVPGQAPAVVRPGDSEEPEPVAPPGPEGGRVPQR